MEEIETMMEEMTPVRVIECFSVCRDPKDDKFLELAMAGGAHCIVSGDDHLLAMHPFQGIAIWTPFDYLKSTSELTNK